jgi:hypothetical protein
VAFRGKMDDRIWLMLCKQFAHQRRIEDGAANEDMGGISLNGGKIIEVSGVRERVEIDDFVAAANPFEDEVRANESRPSGHQQYIPSHSSLSHVSLSIVDRGDLFPESELTGIGIRLRIRKQQTRFVFL